MPKDDIIYDGQEISAEEQSRLQQEAQQRFEKEYAPYFAKLNDEKWSQLPLSEREEVMQKVEQFEAEQSGRPEADFQTKAAMPMNSRGYYTRNDNTITQNREYTYANSSQYALQNVLHEGRHAYQWDCVQNPQNHPEISDAQRQAWENNFNNYISPKDVEDKSLYFNQPLEADARAYAQERSAFYSNFSASNSSTKGEETSAAQSNSGPVNQILSTPGNSVPESTGNGSNFDFGNDGLGKGSGEDIGMGMASSAEDAEGVSLISGSTEDDSVSAGAGASSGSGIGSDDGIGADGGASEDDGMEM